MTNPAPEKIVITRDELLDARIDERLAQQRAAGPASLQPVTDGRSFSLFYSAWFYLMLAGLFGALLGWELIEPYFQDGIMFVGRVQRVASDDTSADMRAIMVSEIPVVVSTSHTSVRGGPSQQISFTVDDLRVDSVIELRGDLLPDGTGVLASAIRILPPDSPTSTNISLSALSDQDKFIGAALFPAVGGLIGLFIGAVEGLICRTLSRALRCGLFGLLAGAVGGLLSIVAGGLLYELIGQISDDPMASAGAFVLQMFRRGIAWMIAGTTMGLGQGIALKSRRLMLNGFIGGIVGGLIGGLLFDPVDLIFNNRAMFTGASLSRAVGFGIIGLTVGLMIGITDLLTRSAWLRVTAGPLRGKEFSFYQTPIRLGSSPKNQIYLFKDTKIEPIHAVINKLRDTYEIEDQESKTGTIINGQRTKRKRLTDGDRIQIGDSEFIYSTREKRAA
jgi:hypothetical protein